MEQDVVQSSESGNSIRAFTRLTNRRQRTEEVVARAEVQLSGGKKVQAEQTTLNVWKFTCPTCKRKNVVSDLSQVIDCKFDHSNLPS